MSNAGEHLLTIFSAALDRPAGTERDGYLDVACGPNAELRGRVEALLRAHARAGAFLEAAPAATPPTGPLGPAAPAAAADEPAVGGVLAGRYRLLEVIGEGGMGAVWLAQQTEPVKRLVAIKLIRPGMDSQAVLARFEAERQALALMDHPNIARVLDAGASPGRPYFVMELVKGVPITRFCDEHRLTPRQRLELFLPVCAAIQHAHQKGIIHRDIKPSNVLVACCDGRPVVKVIDFGVAKAIGQQLTEQTLHTGFGAIIGTLEYMSPEQASFNALDVDTRSDVYSLGVLLYELLTGNPPFTRQDHEKGGVLEMLRLIREQEPTRPGTRLSTAEGLPALAASRGVEPSRLPALVRGELDWIVMKALEKDRRRRYDSAGDFALDVRRYLADEPVLACPPSVGYRLGKFVRRNRGPVLAALLVLTSLLVGLTGAIWQAFRAAAAESRTRMERDDKERALQEERRARQEATQASRQTLQALREMVDEISERQLGRPVQVSGEDRAFLQRVLAHYDRFADLKGDSPGTRHFRAEGAYRVGIIRRHLGEHAAALRNLRRARKLLDELARAFPADAAYRRDLAICHDTLAVLLAEQGDREAAVAEIRRARELIEQLAAELPSDQEYRELLGTNHHNLGWLLRGQGDLSAAEMEYRRALAVRRQLVVDFASSPRYRRQAALTQNNLGHLLWESSKRDEGLAELRRARKARERLVADHPTVPLYREDLAGSQHNLGVVLAAAGKHDEAETAFHAALRLARELAADFPTVPGYRHQLASTHCSLGHLWSDRRRFDRAEGQYRQALQIQERLAADFPGGLAYRQALADTHYSLGNLLNHRAAYREAEAEYGLAVRLQKELVSAAPRSPVSCHQLARTYSNRGVALVLQGKRADAEKDFQRAIDLYKPLVQEFPGNTTYASELAHWYRSLANVIEEQGRLADSLERLDGAVATATRLLAKKAIGPVFLRNCYWDRARVLMQLGRFSEALADWDQTVEREQGAFGPYFRLRRAACRARLDPARAVAEVEAILAGGRQPASLLYEAAAVYGAVTTSIQGEQQRELHALRAMHLLEQARAAGYLQDRSRIDRLRQGPDFAPLRSRSDFRKLLDRLGAK